MRHENDIISREEMIELTGTPLNPGNAKHCAGLVSSSWKGLMDTPKQHGATSLTR
jgi:hypothetical protein